MVLFDTHAILWALADDPRLGAAARDLFDDPKANVVVSLASVWEMAIKLSLGKLLLDRSLAEMVQQVLPDQGIPTLPVEDRHAVAVATMPFHHRDPFDRLLAATALATVIPSTSADPVFEAYGVRRVW